MSYPQKLSTGFANNVDTLELRNKSSKSRSTTRIFKTYLTNAIRSGALRREAERVISKRRTRAIGTVLCLSAFIATTSQTNAEALINSDHYKLYLHSKIINYKQFTCAIEVGHRESRWNPSAHNGKHYGIFQMENAKVRYMNPYTQIDWWMRYVHTRYDGNYCKSLAHLKNKGWQ